MGYTIHAVLPLKRKGHGLEGLTVNEGVEGCQFDQSHQQYDLTVAHSGIL